MDTPKAFSCFVRACVRVVFFLGTCPGVWVSFPPLLDWFFAYVFSGKLTTEQIKAGYEALKKIDDCIRKNDFGSKLVRACDEFYTRIPHCFG